MSPLISLFLFVLIDVLGFSIVLPLFPFLSKDFSMSPTLIGLVQTSNAAAQLLAVPVIGAMSDQYGRRPLLILCVLGTFLSFVMLATATSPTMVFASRILDGLLGGNTSLAQAYIADVTNDANREKGMGVLGASFGLGFIVGPAVGGMLAPYGWWVPPSAAAALSLINLISVAFFLPESLTPENRVAVKRHSLVPAFRNIYKCFQLPGLAILLWTRFWYGIVFTMAIETVFGFYNKTVLNMDARGSSYALCWFGLLFAGIQGGGIKGLRKRYATSPLLVSAFGLLAFLLALAATVGKVWQLWLLLTPMGIACGLCNTLLVARVSREVDQRSQGSSLGVSAGLSSLTRIVAPTFGGILIDSFNVQTPYLVTALLALYLVYLARKVPEPHQHVA